MSASSARIMEVNSFNPQDILHLEEAKKQMQEKLKFKNVEDELPGMERVKPKS